MSRFIPKIFAENANDNVVFGSWWEQGGQIGDGTVSNDPETLQSNAAWLLGLAAATNNFFKLLRSEEFNGVLQVITAAIVQQMRDGISFWQSEMPVTQYQTIVQYQTGSDLPKLYINITGTSTSTPPDSDTTNWYMFFDTGAFYANTDLSNLSATGEAHFADPDLSNLSVTGEEHFQAPITLTASKALVSNSSGKVAASSVTSTELGYLSGVTSGIQTQLGGKLGSINYGSATDVTSSVFAASGTGYKPTKKGVLLIKVYNSLGYCDINIYKANGTAILARRMNDAPAAYTSAGGTMELLLDTNFSVRITANAGTAGTNYWATFFPYA